MAIVVLGKQVRPSPAPVPRKALRDRWVLHHPAGDRRQVKQRVVAAALLEFGPGARRPALVTDFVAVNDDVVESLALAGERPEVIEHLLHAPGPMGVECLLAELVAFKPGTCGGGGMILLSLIHI